MRSMKKIIYYSLLISFFTAFDYQPQGFLRVDGKKIINDVDDNLSVNPKIFKDITTNKSIVGASINIKF